MVNLSAWKSWLWFAAAAGALLAAPTVNSALVLRDPTPPSFTSGSDGANGTAGTGQNGGDGTDQPSPQTATLDQNGTYTGMDCGKGGDGGGGGSGTVGSAETAGGKGGNGMAGKKGATITIYVSAAVTLSGGHGPNGGNGGRGGNGGAGCPPGGPGTNGGPGGKGQINWVLIGSGSLNSGSFTNAVDGANGGTGTTGARLCP